MYLEVPIIIYKHKSNSGQFGDNNQDWDAAGEKLKCIQSVRTTKIGVELK